MQNIISAFKNYNSENEIVYNLLIVISSIALNEKAVKVLANHLDMIISLFLSTTDSGVLEAAVVALWNLSLDGNPFS